MTSQLILPSKQTPFDFSNSCLSISIETIFAFGAKFLGLLPTSCVSRRDPKTGKLPLTNPIAKALEGTKEGDEVSVGPNTFKVLKLN